MDLSFRRGLMRRELRESEAMYVLSSVNAEDSFKLFLGRLPLVVIVVLELGVVSFTVEVLHDLMVDERDPLEVKGDDTIDKALKSEPSVSTQERSHGGLLDEAHHISSLVDAGRE